MIIPVLTVSLTLVLGMVCSVFAQSDDIGSVVSLKYPRKNKPTIIVQITISINYSIQSCEVL